MSFHIKKLKKHGNSVYSQRKVFRLNRFSSDLQNSIELQAQHDELANELASASKIIEKKDEEMMRLREDLISLNDHCSSQTLEIAAKKQK